MNIEQVSTNSLIIYFGETISKEISLEVQNKYNAIKNLNNSNILEIIPSYTSIFITYNIKIYSFDNIKDLLLNLSNSKIENLSNNQLIVIDVYYGTEVGLDLENISKYKKLTIDDIISIHSQKIYDVFAIGFLPGFAFLGLVDEKIQTPRLKTPRNKVLKGSVAIADNQTAVYPQNSAGGWNIIGKTTKELFDKSLKELSPLSVGKQVKFNPITKNEFLNQGGIIS